MENLKKKETMMLDRKCLVDDTIVTWSQPKDSFPNKMQNNTCKY
jgi:hypothetical protein